jgi:hypothetical protein
MAIERIHIMIVFGTFKRFLKILENFFKFEPVPHFSVVEI